MSPIIATVLLIMIVIVLSIVILIWMQGFIKEAITKQIADKEKRVEEFCNEVGISAFVNDDNSFGFKNTGNVPIYAVNVKLTTGGSSETKRISFSDGGMVNPGFSTVIKDINHIENDGDDFFDYSLYDKVEIIPILLGRTKKGGTQEFPCPEINAMVV